ncbi:MAG TPA: glycoside hydrolase domain-containing protein [Marmoricola sp.]|nr:glycoside hydrolase domain-containing protein [Marmoricola sp.]
MPSLPRLRRTLAGLTIAGLGATVGLTASTSTATTPNPITPGNMVGYGFDQCEAPSQAAMTTWLKYSPFRAVGIYMSGSLRYCQAQTNLTPTWVRTQLATGWRLLPIHLGAQASCTTRDRYQKDKISADSTDGYSKARAQGRYEANVATNAATALGIVAKSTIYYDLEAFDAGNSSCRLSSLYFLQAWTRRLHTNGYVSGVYSSAASGIKVLDDARVTVGNTITMPDQIWIADWNKKADVSSTYIRSDGWPGRRIHQYQGGHTETYGGVTINIDRNYLDLRGNAATPPPPSTPEQQASKYADAKCTTASINRTSYRKTAPGLRSSLYVPLQCLLKQRGLYTRSVTGTWGSATTRAVKAWQGKVHHKQQKAFTRSDWTSLLAAGTSRTVLKAGVRGPDVIRAQRALNAAMAPYLKITGVYDKATQVAVGAYQKRVGISPTRVVATLTWRALTKGRR